jgi:hypothetical protein
MAQTHPGWFVLAGSCETPYHRIRRETGMRRLTNNQCEDYRHQIVVDEMPREHSSLR